jgi:hypothetical protein
MKAKCAVLIFMVSGLLLSGPVVYAASADHALYASLLSRHVKNGLVDYRGVKDDEALLDQYLDVLAAVDPESLTADRQFAFYANAYNAEKQSSNQGQIPGLRLVPQRNLKETTMATTTTISASSAAARPVLPSLRARRSWAPRPC